MPGAWPSSPGPPRRAHSQKFFWSAQEATMVVKGPERIPYKGCGREKAGVGRKHQKTGRHKGGCEEQKGQEKEVTPGSHGVSGPIATLNSSGLV